MNNVCIKGRIVKDIELRSTPSGTSVCDITIAVKNTQEKDNDFFFDCVAWGKTSEFVDKYFEKGKEILISGELRQDKWQDKETGGNRSKIKINVRTVDFCGYGDKPSNQYQQNNSGQQNNYDHHDNDDAIPF